MNEPCGRCGCTISVSTSTDEPAAICSRCRIKRRSHNITRLCAIFAAICIGAVFLYRAQSLSQIPNIGPPVFSARTSSPIVVDADENAFLQYVGVSITKAPQTRLDWGTLEWTAVTADWKLWLTENVEVLASMDEAAMKPAAWNCLPGQHDETTIIDVSRHRSLCSLALLESSRHLHRHKVEASWHWLRVAFRHSRHVGMSGTYLDRNVGAAFHELTVHAMLHWASHSAVTVKMLQRAFDEVRKDFLLTPPLSDSLRNDYFFEVNTFDVASTIISLPAVHRNRVRQWIDCEPERGRRLMNLVYANWARQVDLPLYNQKPLPESQFGLFVNSEVGAEDDVDAKSLEQWCIESTVANELLKHKQSCPKSLYRELARQRLLELSLAAHLQFRDRGRFPATVEEFRSTTLPDWPFDPMSVTRRPLGYRSSEDGKTAIIWSVGQDGIDDNGRLLVGVREANDDLRYLLSIKEL